MVRIMKTIYFKNKFKFILFILLRKKSAQKINKKIINFIIYINFHFKINKYNKKKI